MCLFVPVFVCLSVLCVGSVRFLICFVCRFVCLCVIVVFLFSFFVQGVEHNGHFANVSICPVGIDPDAVTKVNERIDRRGLVRVLGQIDVELI